MKKGRKKGRTRGVKELQKEVERERDSLTLPLLLSFSPRAYLATPPFSTLQLSIYFNICLKLVLALQRYAFPTHTPLRSLVYLFAFGRL